MLEGGRGGLVAAEEGVRVVDEQELDPGRRRRGAIARAVVAHDTAAAAARNLLVGEALVERLALGEEDVDVVCMVVCDEEASGELGLSWRNLPLTPLRACARWAGARAGRGPELTIILGPGTALALGSAIARHREATGKRL